MKNLILAIIIAGATAVSANAQAIPNGCWPNRDAMVAELSGEPHNERQLMSGVSLKYKNNGIMGFEFWVNPISGSYTYVFIRNDGLVCIGDTGNTLGFGPFENEVATEPEGSKS